LLSELAAEFEMRKATLWALLLSGLAWPASAQMAVSTFGATDAQSCYEDAREVIVSDVGNCDEALRGVNLTARDRRATLVNRGIILNRAGRIDEALADFDRAIADDAALAEAYLNRGNSHYLAGRFDAAISDYRRALDNGLEKDFVAWYNIGLAQEAKKDPVAARAAYRTALERNPNFSPARDKLDEANVESAQ
jgi:tetratricopeptide (TPR) repeat protein